MRTGHHPSIRLVLLSGVSTPRSNKKVGKTFPQKIVQSTYDIPGVYIYIYIYIYTVHQIDASRQDRQGLKSSRNKTKTRTARSGEGGGKPDIYVALSHDWTMYIAVMMQEKGRGRKEQGAKHRSEEQRVKNNDRTVHTTCSCSLCRCKGEVKLKKKTKKLARQYNIDTEEEISLIQGEYMVPAV